MTASNLTHGPIWRALVKTSAPMSLGILAVLSVGIADAYFLGQLGGEPLAAVGFIYPVTAAITSLSIGLSAGANSAISQAIGREDDERAINQLSLHAIGLGLGLTVFVSALFFAMSGFIFTAMGASEGVRAEIAQYVPAWAASFPFLVLMMTVNAVFRAHGDAGYASIFMILAACVNIALNPLFIFGFAGIEGLGTGGAALATFVGRLLAAVAAVYFAIRWGYLKRCGTFLTGVRDNLREIVGVGAPAAFSNATNPAGMALVTAAVATLGDAAVAGFGAATRIQSIAIVVMLALSSGIGPVVGQNWGAEKYDRARSAVLQSWLFCVAYGGCLAVLLFWLAEPLAGLIASSSEEAEYAAQYLRIVGWSLMGYGVLVTANAAMNARSKARYSMMLSLGRIFAVYLPLAWFGVGVFGYEGILAAAVVANVAAIAGSLYFCSKSGLFGGLKFASTGKAVWS